jgi:hypothetical protein
MEEDKCFGLGSCVGSVVSLVVLGGGGTYKR